MHLKRTEVGNSEGAVDGSNPRVSEFDVSPLFQFGPRLERHGPSWERKTTNAKLSDADVREGTSKKLDAPLRIIQKNLKQKRIGSTREKHEKGTRGGFQGEVRGTKVLDTYGNGEQFSRVAKRKVSCRKLAEQTHRSAGTYNPVGGTTAGNLSVLPIRLHKIKFDTSYAF